MPWKSKFLSKTGRYVDGYGNYFKKMYQFLRQVYEQMSEPRWVIVVGVCASSAESSTRTSVLQGIDKVIPVDVYVPGCPQDQEQIVEGVMKLKKSKRIG